MIYANANTSYKFVQVEVGEATNQENPVSLGQLQKLIAEGQKKSNFKLVNVADVVNVVGDLETEIPGIDYSLPRESRLILVLNGNKNGIYYQSPTERANGWTSPEDFQTGTVVIAPNALYWVVGATSKTITFQGLEFPVAAPSLSALPPSLINIKKPISKPLTGETEGKTIFEVDLSSELSRLPPGTSYRLIAISQGLNPADEYTTDGKVRLIFNSTNLPSEGLEAYFSAFFGV